jgi:3-deoxy-D-manno-octulosonate 8-phosphate phosphatase (KDO 8-P phosphatase)
MKAFNVKDGQGIALLQSNGIMPVILTARKSKIVENRAKELGITEVHQGSKDKVKVLSYLCEKFNVTTNEIAYIGDDLGDLLAMKAVGLSFCPADSVNEILKCADIKLNHNGGEGAVREAVEYLLNITINNN